MKGNATSVEDELFFFFGCHLFYSRKHFYCVKVGQKRGQTKSENMITQPIIDSNIEKWSKAVCRKLQPLITVEVNVPSAVYATAAAVLQV